MRRGWLLALLALLLAALPVVPMTAAAAAPSDALCNEVAPGRQNVGKQTVVLLVHGFNSGMHAWTGGDGSMISTLSAIQGVTVRAFDYGEASDEWVTHPDVGPRLGATIYCYGNASAEQGGTGKIVIVAHSMGGLATRCALDEKCGGYAGNADRVGMVVTLGTPNTGSFLQKTGSGAHTGVGGALGGLCWAGEVGGAPVKEVCDQIRALGTSNASNAFVPGSRQLRALAPFPDGLEVHAVAGEATLSVRHFFAPPLRMAAGDLIVGVDSATVGTDDDPPVVVDCGTWSFITVPGSVVPGAVEQFGSCWHGSETSYLGFVSVASQFVSEYHRRHGCGLRNDAPAVAEAVAQLPESAGYPWETNAEWYDGNFDPCATLSAVVLPIQNGSISSARHVLLFSKGEFVRTGTDEPWAGAFLNHEESTDDTVVIDYSYMRPWDASLAGASGRARLTFTWDGSDVRGDGQLPDDMVNPPADLTISPDGFSTAFTWGTPQADAEAALGMSFELTDMGDVGNCSQAALDGIIGVTFGVEDGVVTSASVQEVLDVGLVPVADTGIALGDPVSEVRQAYPDAVQDTDPSDASTIRWRWTDGQHTAQFLSFDGATVQSMSFGLTGSVGDEGPCV